MNATTALAKQETGLRTVHEDYFSEEQWRLLTDVIMKGANRDEVSCFGMVCQRVGLDPFKKQIHAVQRWDSTQKRNVWTYQTGIDGYRSIAASTGSYAGSDEPMFIPADESAPNPRKATVTVWKIVAGQRVPFTASARWDEYVQLTREGNPNSMWRKMPYGQLSKCAEALALRKAFPERLSGLLTDVEMEQADSESERAGPQPAGRPAHFSLESKPFEPTSQTPEQASQQPADEKPIEAEIIHEIKIAEPIGKWTSGKWKESLGPLTGKAMTDARASAFENYRENPVAAQQALASIIDEVRARLVSKGITESKFADLASTEKIIEWPADLWNSPEAYLPLLKFCKTLK